MRAASGFAPGGNAAKFGGPARCASSAERVRGSGRARDRRCEGALIFGTPPRPETPFFAGGFPPLILTPVEVFPAPPLFPPRLSGSPPLPPLLAAGFAGAPPGTPGCLPSGEIARRAERLPWGSCAGA